MALNVSKVIPNSPILAKKVNGSRSQRVLLAFSPRKGSSSEELQGLCCTKPVTFVTSRRSSTLCFLGKSQDTETKPHEDCLDLPNSQIVQKEGEKQVMPRRKTNSSQVLVEYVSNDAKFVNERARSDFVLLSRGIMRLDARARQDVAILGSGFLKLDARAREDTEKIDRDVKRKAERLHHIATILKNIAQSKLKNAADKHWSDGALEADLRRADFRAKQRAMEDALMALEFIKNIHDMMVQKMVDSLVTSETGVTDRISLEKNGKALDFFPGEVSSDRISAIEEAYKSMASALSEADGIDYTDPEELELLVTTLIDLDAMDGKSSASLLAECSSSPDVNTRKALANALAAAPSMWTLGNAGMGALQRLAEDSNPAIAAAASRAIIALKKQWEVEEGDSLRFMMNLEKPDDDDDGEDCDNDEI
ncbi:hypothetical protein EUTSA_v10018612mg [Eutrema salsugineum]|uniref:Senescence domain-containing protein n=2 Tax=Eutrema salsugineum TaxID=72664 RepID=V4MBU0_EUTSA|nr:senescence-associated protein AAF, chlorolplastic [Eutrema salsugineum]XP_024008887.1 senescence-associated protein AAF, chlorolplastic [Eutrema salsugineum]ESQ28661.1 hypothetical protein EUTSA_v10018612mg [Eutrema salsugineum]